MSIGLAQPAVDPGVAVTPGALFGFLGAGIILRAGLNVRGLNTAATL